MTAGAVRGGAVVAATPFTGGGNAHIGAVLLTSLGSAGFAWNQNRHPEIGGPIHWSKVLWLNLAINVFVVLPGVWWRRSTASPAARHMLGVAFGSWVARGAAEMYLVYVVRRWKMRYGISHDAVAFAVLGTMLVRDRASLDRERDAATVAFTLFTLAMYVVEIAFALRFRRITDPATGGVFFADDSPKYRGIITSTKRVVAISYPIFAAILWAARRDFPGGATRRAGRR
ncbi:MAG: hypothetical protein JWN72_1945 [Thermoleophilia bacterium]|nr:hypothetical protein [Thermoleophilia bacterium]